MIPGYICQSRKLFTLHILCVVVVFLSKRLTHSLEFNYRVQLPKTIRTFLFNRMKTMCHKVTAITIATT